MTLQDTTNAEQGIYRARSNCRIRVYTFASESPDPTDTDSGFAYDLNGELRSVNVHSDITEDTGSFQFTLIPRLNFRDGEYDPSNSDQYTIVRPGDWVRIFFDDGRPDQRSIKIGNGKDAKSYQVKSRLPDGYPPGFVERCLGMVDRVSRVVAQSGTGARQVRYMVTGRTFMKAVVRTDVFFHPWAEGSNLGGALLFQKGFKQEGSPDQITERMLNALMGSAVKLLGSDVEVPQFVLPKVLYKELSKAEDHPRPGVDYTRSMKQTALDTYIQRDIKPCDGKMVAGTLQIEQSSSLISMIKEFSNDLLNEFYGETMPYQKDDGTWEMRPTLRLRERPYTLKHGRDLGNYDIAAGESTNYFEDLPYIDLSESDVKGEDLGVSDAERKSWFELVSSALTIDGRAQEYDLGKPGEYPIVDNVSIMRYGLNRLLSSSKFAASENFIESLRKWTNLIRSWYRDCPLMLNGTLETRPFLVATIGMRLVYTRKYYSEGKRVTTQTGKGGYSGMREHYYIQGCDLQWDYNEQGSEMTQTFTLVRGLVENDQGVLVPSAEASGNQIAITLGKAADQFNLDSQAQLNSFNALSKGLKLEV